MPLRGLEKRLDQGDGVALPQVYVTLATGSLVVLASGGSKELRRYFQDGKLDQPLKQDYDPNHAPLKAALRAAGIAVDDQAGDEPGDGEHCIIFSALGVNGHRLPTGHHGQSSWGLGYLLVYLDRRPVVRVIVVLGNGEMLHGAFLEHECHTGSTVAEPPELVALMYNIAHFHADCD